MIEQGLNRLSREHLLFKKSEAKHLKQSTFAPKHCYIDIVHHLIVATVLTFQRLFPFQTNAIQQKSEICGRSAGLVTATGTTAKTICCKTFFVHA